MSQEPTTKYDRKETTYIIFIQIWETMPDILKRETLLKIISREGSLNHFANYT